MLLVAFFPEKVSHESVLHVSKTFPLETVATIREGIVARVAI